MIGKRTWLSLSLFVLLASSCLLAVRAAEEDVTDGEVADEGDTEPEEVVTEKPIEESLQQNSKGNAGDGIGPSSDAQVYLLFTQPTNTRELIAGQIVKFLIGFANKGEKDFIIKASDTSFRYPMDFSYHIQNFSSVRYNQVVQPKQEATFDYSFIPSESFIGRPLGLTVNLHYVDTEGNFYVNAAFNETVNIVEDETSFSTETGFLYVVLAGMGVLILLVGQHLLSKFTKKQSTSTYQPTHELGTNVNEVDYEWIPRTNFLEKKSPKTRRPAKAN